MNVSAYRIVQEALTNVLKHAGPARAEVAVGCADSAVTIEVTDDGPGEPGSPRHWPAGRDWRACANGSRYSAVNCAAGPRPGGGFTVAPGCR